MKTKMVHFLIFSCLMLQGVVLIAQTGQVTGRTGSSKSEASYTWDNVILNNGDTSYVYTLKVQNVYSLRVFKDPKMQRKYDRLVKHVKKVYPYAKLAGDMLKEEEAKVAGLSKSERKAHMKKVEKRLEQQFGKELRNLNFTQGRILLKLIDRQTGHTSYELVDDLRGTFSAWFYDGLAGLFGYDMKSEYDPRKYLEDRCIEELVVMIENGQL